VPFLGFKAGSLELAVLSSLQKFPLFGSSIWLAAKAVLQLRPSIIVTAAILFAMSYADAYLPNRAAEIIDTLMALLIGAIFALLATNTRRNDAPVKEPQRGRQPAASGREPADKPITEARTAAPPPIDDRKNRPGPRTDSDTAFRDRKHFQWTRSAGLIATATCFTLATVIIAHYPLAPLAFGRTRACISWTGGLIRQSLFARR
jgi:hypothetical protein